MCHEKSRERYLILGFLSVNATGNGTRIQELHSVCAIAEEHLTLESGFDHYGTASGPRSDTISSIIRECEYIKTNTVITFGGEETTRLKITQEGIKEYEEHADEDIKSFCSEYGQMPTSNLISSSVDISYEFWKEYNSV